MDQSFIIFFVVVKKVKMIIAFCLGLHSNHDSHASKSTGIWKACQWKFSPWCWFKLTWHRMVMSIVWSAISARNTFKKWRSSVWYLRKSIRDNQKIFTESEKMFLKSEKTFQIVMFFGNHRLRVYQIWKTITSLNKIIEFANIILFIIIIKLFIK